MEAYHGLVAVFPELIILAAGTRNPRSSFEFIACLDGKFGVNGQQLVHLFLKTLELGVGVASIWVISRVVEVLGHVSLFTQAINNTSFLSPFSC